MLTVEKITSAQLRAAGYAGPRGGYISGNYYAVKDTEKGYIALESGRAYMLQGPHGKAALQAIIDAGGFGPGAQYVQKPF